MNLYRAHGNISSGVDLYARITHAHTWRQDSEQNWYVATQLISGDEFTNSYDRMTASETSSFESFEGIDVVVMFDGLAS